jgi:hypothetical protein
MRQDSRCHGSTSGSTEGDQALASSVGSPKPRNEAEPTGAIHLYGFLTSATTEVLTIVTHAVCFLKANDLIHNANVRVDVRLPLIPLRDCPLPLALRLLYPAGNTCCLEEPRSWKPNGSPSARPCAGRPVSTQNGRKTHGLRNEMGFSVNWL